MHQTIDECYIYRAVVPAMRPKSAFEPPIPKTASNEVYNLSSLFCSCTTWRWMKHEDVRCCNTHVSRGRQITRILGVYSTSTRPDIQPEMKSPLLDAKQRRNTILGISLTLHSICRVLNPVAARLVRRFDSVLRIRTLRPGVILSPGKHR